MKDTKLLNVDTLKEYWLNFSPHLRRKEEKDEEDVFVSNPDTGFDSFWDP